MRTARNVAVSNADALEPITMAGVIFLAASYPTALAVRRLERRLEGGPRTRRPARWRLPKPAPAQAPAGGRGR